MCKIYRNWGLKHFISCHFFGSLTLKKLNLCVFFLSGLSRVWDQIWLTVPFWSKRTDQSQFDLNVISILIWSPEFKGNENEICRVKITKTVATLAEQCAHVGPRRVQREADRENMLFCGSRMREQRVNKLKTLEKSFELKWKHEVYWYLRCHSPVKTTSLQIWWFFRLKAGLSVLCYWERLTSRQKIQIFKSVLSRTALMCSEGICWFPSPPVLGLQCQWCGTESTILAQCLDVSSLN